MSTIERQSGQIGLVVLLIMTALLSVGISAVNKSTQDLRITREEVESSQTFNAAEDGMEQALQVLDDHFSGGGTLPDSQTTFSPDSGTTQVAYEISQESEFEMAVNNNSVVRFDLGNTSPVDWVFEWGIDPVDCDNASIVIIAYDTVNFTARRWAYEPYNCSSSNFDDALNGSPNYHSKANVSFTANEDVVRVRVIGGDTVLHAYPGVGGNLNTQFYVLRSRAERVDGEQVKLVEVRRSLPTLPFVFDYALFSGSSLVKN